MLIMAKNTIAAGAGNHPPMHDKSKYSSWRSHMLLSIKGKEHGKKLYNLFINVPFKYGTVPVLKTSPTPATISDRTYDELIDIEKIRKACDIKATNIVLQGLLQDIFNLVNHHTNAKEIWDSVKLLIEGSEHSLQERESKLYDEFEIFTSVPGKTIHLYYLRQCTKPKRLRNLSWFKEKMLLVEALELGVVLDKEHMSFLADNKDTVTTGQESQEIPTPAIFQTNDLDAFDSYCDKVPSTSVALMAKLFAYESDVLSKVPTQETYLDNQVIDQSVQEMLYYKQLSFINDPNIDITNDSNVISYEQYLKEIKNEVVQYTPSSTQ
nr:hypothetical protein [Tanacetum cinerariifolium]